MAVTITNRVELPGGDVRVEWTSSLGADALCYVYLDDLLQGTTLRREWVFTWTGDTDTHLVRILDEPAGGENPGYPVRAFLLWWPVDGASAYVVEEDVGGWVERAKLVDKGQGVFSWESRVLEDDATHDFRVRPIGTDANEGSNTELSLHMVRHPNGPVVEYAYSSGTGKVTISDAA